MGVGLHGDIGTRECKDGLGGPREGSLLCPCSSPPSQPGKPKAAFNQGGEQSRGLSGAILSFHPTGHGSSRSRRRRTLPLALPPTTISLPIHVSFSFLPPPSPSLPVYLPPSPVTFCRETPRFPQTLTQAASQSGSQQLLLLDPSPHPPPPPFEGEGWPPFPVWDLRVSDQSLTDSCCRVRIAG